jgi:hypothetical protein
LECTLRIAQNIHRQSASLPTRCTEPRNFINLESKCFLDHSILPHKVAEGTLEFIGFHSPFGIELMQNVK